MPSYSFADEKVSIIEACHFIGMPFAIAGMKLQCPFGDVSHADGGQAASFRIYEETNSAFCFACALPYTPTKLVAAAKDVSRVEAAELLLESIGYVERTPEQQWAEANSYEQEEISRSAAAEALKLYCSRIDPSWKTHQLDPIVSKRLQVCLSLLDLVRSDADVDAWLRDTKTAMSRVLGVQES